MNQTNYSPGAIANYFLEKAWNKSCGLAPMHLQKLLYFANGWYMAFYNIDDNIFPLINEPFRAWEYGPVCDSIYYDLIQFGKSVVPKKYLISEICISSNLEDIEIKTNMIPSSNKEIIELLNDVWNKYGLLFPEVLSTMIRCDDSDNPWRKAKHEGECVGIVRGKEIESNSIRFYFKKLISEQRGY